jgi:hypothetical protein
VRLDAGAVDEEPVRHPISSSQGTEETFPYPALRPAHEPVVERLFWAIDRWAITPPTTALQRMNYPRQHAAIINAPCAFAIDRQKRFNP